MRPKQQKEMSESEQKLLNKLLPRMFKLKHLHIPKSNESEVIVEPNKSVMGFKTNCYKLNAKYLSNYITRQQFDSVVFKANKIIQEQVMENRRRECRDPFAEATLFLRIAVTLTLIGIVFMAIIVYGNFVAALEQIMQYVGIGLICASVFFAVLMVFFIHKTKYVPLSFEEHVWRRLTELMSEETKALAESGRGFMIWGVGQQFFWMSLSISYLHMPKNFDLKTSIGSPM